MPTNKEFSEMLLNEAIKSGAEGAEVFLHSSKNLNIEVKDNKIDTLEKARPIGYSIRIIKDKKQGFSYSTELDKFKDVINNALETAKYSEQDEYLSLPNQTNKPSQVKVFDENIDTLNESKAINLVLSIEKAALGADKRIKNVRNVSCGFGVTNTLILNSNGINYEYLSTFCSANILAVAEDGGDSQIGGDYKGTRFLKDISFENLGKTAAKRAVQLLGAKKSQSVKKYVLLDSMVSVEFLGLFSNSLSSDAMQKNKSLFVGKKDKIVISDRLNIVDSGVIDGRIGSRPVDSEGVVTSKKILINQGVLKGFLYNTYTANKEGVQSTGNAVRGGFKNIPSVGITNLYLEPSSKTDAYHFAHIVKNIDKGLYITETMGMHTANPVSGDFSIGVTGLWIEGGEILYPVKESVISGNILDLFKKVIMIGNDLCFYGNIGSPSLMIEGVDISG